MRIRRIYIPELVIRLHAALVESGDKIPAYVLPTLPPSPFPTNLFQFNRNLTHALSLANVVADSRYGLYEDFVAENNGASAGAGATRLQKYLLAVRQAVLKGLENGGSDPFRILH